MSTVFSTLFLALIALFSTGFPCQGQSLDRYGGRKDVRCSGEAGKWRTQQIGNRWWVCTPDGNGLLIQGVEDVESTDDLATQKMQEKYGGAVPWSEATLKRLTQWGFNALGVYAYNMVWPTARENGLPGPGHSHSIKLPFFSEVRPALYSMRNPSIHTWKGQDVRFLSDPVKNVFAARSSYFTGYLPPGGVGDYFDPKMQIWMKKAITEDWSFAAIKASPDNNYLLGIFGDDGDELQGFSAGPDFPTAPPGKNNPDLALLILSESPVLTADPDLEAVYADSAMHTKLALRDALGTKYKTVEALNHAWGSNYTTLDSSGRQITADQFAGGDGATLSFIGRISHTTASRDSVQVRINDSVVGGDDGKGNLYGPNLSGTVNYKTGDIRLLFKPGHAPPAGSRLNASYMQNGWEIGTGFLDEDMRAAHHSWLGDDWYGGSANRTRARRMNPAVRTDLDAFLKEMAEWYFKMLRDGIHSEFPNTMVLLGLGTWSGVPPAPVLQAASEYLDIIENSELGGVFDQARMDFMTKNYGNKPYMPDLFLQANLDSAFRAKSLRESIEPDAIKTQSAKGDKYAETVSYLLHAKNSAGVNPHIGFMLWAWMDKWSEQSNWGLVSHLDNAYDGKEDVTAKVPCSPPFQNLSCGGEPGDYGDYISKVRQANSLWLSIAP
ncbi:MAG: hypothetical protein WA823_11870 [Candidatus Acidiferrales bacterium]